MFELTNRELADLLSVINDSGIASFHLKTADYEISISCVGDDVRPPTGPAQIEAQPLASAATEGSMPQPQEAPAPQAPSEASAEQVPGREHRQEQEGTTAVDSPMVGAFYVAPEPGAPPYVEVGATVAPDSTVGLIEAMKVFTAVTAGVHGVVSAVLVGNGEFVEYGQPLVLVAAADDPGTGHEGTDQA